jgi:tetratricopeptide (TPR) repeat protein
VLERPRGGDRRLQQGARDRLRRSSRHRRADQALPRPVALARSARRLRQEGRSRRRPEEKKGIYYQVGAVYERELGDVPRAIDTYTKILELDPDDLQALSRLDVLYEQAQNWPELLSVLTRESEMTGDPNEAISFQYRIASSTRSTSTTCRARSSSIARSSSAAGPRADAARPRRPQGRRQGPARRRRGARARLRAASDWPKLVACTRFRSARGRSVPEGRAAPPHRAPLRGRAGRPRVGVRHVRARLALDDGNEQTLGTSSAGDGRQPLAGGREALRRRARQARQRTRSASSSSGCATRRSSRCSSRTSTARSRATAAWSRSTPRTRRDPRARSALHADRALGRPRAILAREAEIGQSPTRSSSSSTASGRSSRRAERPRRAIARVPRRHQRAPEHQADARGARGALRERRPSSSSRRDPRAALPLDGEWEKLSRVYEAQLAHTHGEGRGRRSASRPTTASPSSFEEKLLDPPKDARRLHPRPQGVPARREGGRGGAAPRGGVDGGWETLANAYADVLGRTPIQRAALDRQAPREDVRGRARRHRKAEETYKYVLGVEPLDVEALANLDRIYLSLESWPELAQILEMRVKATTDSPRARRALRAPRRALRDAPRRHPNAIRAYRRIFDELDKTHEGAIARSRASTSARALEGARRRLRARARERRGRHGRGRDPRQDRAPRRRQARLNPSARSRRGSRARPARRGPRGAPRAREPLRVAQAVGELVDVLEREFDIASSDEDRVNILTRRARIFSDKLGRDDAALEDWNRVLDIDYANLGRCARSRRSGGARAIRTSSSRAPPARRSRGGDARRRRAQGDLPRARQDVRRAAPAAVRRGRRVAQAARGRPDFEAMDALEAIYRGEERGPTSSTSRCSAPRRSRSRPRRSPSYRSVAALWREQVGEPDSRRRVREDPRDRPDARRGVHRAREAPHAAGAGSRSSSSTSRASRRARRRARRPSSCARSRASSRSSSTTRSRRSTRSSTRSSEDFHDRETAATSSGWRRRRAAGTRSSRPSTVAQAADRARSRRSGSACTSPSGTATTSATPSTRSPTTRRSSSSTRTTSARCARWGSSTRRRQLAAAGRDADARARRRVNDLDRKEILTELGELLDAQMQQTEQAITYFQRALEVDPQFLPALENLERIYTARGQNRELVDVLQRKVPALSEPAEIAATKLRIAQLYETSLGDPRGRRRSIARSSTSTHEPPGAARPRASTSCSSSGPSSSACSRAQLDVVTTERERIEVLMHLATLQEEHFLKADLAAQRLEQVLEIDPNNEEAYFARAQLPQAAAVARSHQHLRPAHRGDARAEDQGRALRRDRAGLRRRIEDNERRSTPTRTSSTSTTTNVPALEALAKLYEKLGDAAQSIDYMTRVAELTQDSQAAGRGVLSDRQGARREARRSRGGAGPLRDGARSRPVAPADARGAPADRDRQRRLRQGRALPRSGAELHAGPAPARALLVELGKLRDEMLGDHDERRARLGGGHEADPENEDAAMPLVDEYITQGEVGEGRAAPRPARAQERASASAASSTICRTSSARSARRSARTTRRSRRTPRRTSSTSPIRSTIRGLAEVCFRLKDWGAALTNFQKVLTALGEDETEARADVYYKLGCIKREQGQAKQAINNFEKALGGRRRAPADARGARLALHRAQGLEAGRRLQAADPRQRVRRRGALPDAQRDRRRLERPRQEPPQGDRGARRGARAAAENHGLLHKLLALYQATENWSKMIDTIQAIAGHARRTRSARASSSTRWRSSIATRRTTRTARSSSSTRRSI